MGTGPSDTFRTDPVRYLFIRHHLRVNHKAITMAQILEVASYVFNHLPSVATYILNKLERKPIIV